MKLTFAHMLQMLQIKFIPIYQRFFIRPLFELRLKHDMGIFFNLVCLLTYFATMNYKTHSCKTN